MKILFDTNIILDVMLLREPFYKSATLLLAFVEAGGIKGYICSTTVTTLYYLISKAKGPHMAKDLLSNLLKLFDVTRVEKSTLQDAMNSGFTDYEDSVLHESALQAGLEGIVTRDSKGFVSAKLSVFSPDELAQLIQSMNN